MNVEENSDIGLEYLQFKKCIKDMTVFISQNKITFPLSPKAYYNREFINNYKKENGL
jgi:hypothetical protein